MINEVNVWLDIWIVFQFHTILFAHSQLDERIYDDWQNDNNGIHADEWASKIRLCQYLKIIQWLSIFVVNEIDIVEKLRMR